MRFSTLVVICSGTLGLLFPILCLIAGCKKGILDGIAIATYTYPINSSLLYPSASPDSTTTKIDSNTYTPTPLLTPQQIQSGIHSFFVSIHFLSLCIGYVGGSENPEYVHLECTARGVGWRFEVDDEWVLNWGLVDGDGKGAKVVRNWRGEEVRSEDTKGAVAGLIAGIITAGFGSVYCAFGSFRNDSNGRIGKLMGIFSFSISTLGSIISSSLLSRIAVRTKWQEGYTWWTSAMLGISWAGTGFMAFAAGLGGWLWFRETSSRKKDMGLETQGQVGKIDVEK